MQQQGHLFFLSLGIGVGLHTLGFQSRHLLLQLLDLFLANQMMGLRQLLCPPGFFQAFPSWSLGQLPKLLLHFLPLDKGGPLSQLLEKLIPFGPQGVELPGESLHLLF